MSNTYHLYRNDTKGHVNLTKVENEQDFLFLEPNAKRAFYLEPYEFVSSGFSERVPVGAVVVTFNETRVRYSEYGTKLHEHPDARYYITEENGLVENTSEQIVDYLKPHLLKYIIRNNSLPPSAKLTSISKGINVRQMIRGNDYYIDFNILLPRDIVPGDVALFAYGLNKVENYTGWSVERDPSGRANCRKCRRRIAKGTLRFVKDGMYYGDSSRDLLKRHPQCMSARNFGYIDPREISGFDSLDKQDQDRLLRELMGWRYPLVVSESTYSKFTEDERRIHQTNILSRMDLGVDLLDADILDEIKTVYQEENFPQFRDHIARISAVVLEKQLWDDGLTLFLDTEKMKERAEMIPLIPRVIELRRQEMENCVVSNQDGSYDLRALWLTHWGFHLLKATHKMLTASERTISRVKNAFSKVGFDVKIRKRKTTEIHVKMSKSMMNFIWQHAKEPDASLSKFTLQIRS